MTNNGQLKPATDLFPEAFRLSHKQRIVLDVLATYREGARVTDIADHLGMHINTARGHLDELVEKGAVHTMSAPSSGRGRPSLIYKARVPDNRIVANEYLSLIQVLGQHLDATDSETIQNLGQQWAKKMAASYSSGLEGVSEGEEYEFEDLVANLTRMGFDPEVCTGANGEVSVCMHSCPFIDDSGSLGEAICDLHRGMMLYHTSRSGLEARLLPLKTGGSCVLEIHQPDPHTTVADHALYDIDAECENAS
ncbi:MAG: helix-turn-helix domain-containing protein [Corynebacterium sp.]|uniref:helix-turn-helix transcriptional regulator n=1 Tax=Corynebacterium sp. TaxID=1720 RepID=UPI0026DC191B|nr:helix-turn-helix domain-containing protein [Corynebacterium sp.]MDO4760568.1 helix-turn-helix domain-containing protein [Corynebacterium sp.]